MIALPLRASLLDGFPLQLPTPPSGSGKETPRSGSDHTGAAAPSLFPLLLEGLFGKADPDSRPAPKDAATSAGLSSSLNPAPQQADESASARLPWEAGSYGEEPFPASPASAIGLNRQFGPEGRTLGDAAMSAKSIHASVGQPGQGSTPSRATIGVPRLHSRPLHGQPSGAVIPTPRRRATSATSLAPQGATNNPSTGQILGLSTQESHTEVPETEVPTGHARAARNFGGNAPVDPNGTSTQPVPGNADLPTSEVGPPSVDTDFPPRIHGGVRSVSGKPPSGSGISGSSQNPEPTAPASRSQSLGSPDWSTATSKPQLHTLAEFEPVKDDEQSQSTTSIQAPGPVPPSPHAGLSAGHPKRTTSTMLPEPVEDSSIPQPSASSPGVEAYLTAAAPSAITIPQPQTRPAGAGEDARPQLSSSRPLGIPASEWGIARRGDDPRTPPEADAEAQLDPSKRAVTNAGKQGQAEASELAFSGRLVPVVATDEPTRRDPDNSRSSLADKPSRNSGLSSLPGPPDPAGEKAVTAVGATSSNMSHREGNPRTATSFDKEDATPSERERKPDAARPGDPETNSANARTVAEPPRLPPASAPAGAARPHAEPAPAERTSALVESEAPKTPASTRDIKLEVGSGDQRVELHLVEHGGDVHVAVRTPDTHLAGELRENLPALSSRLEQTGLRPEEWHTTTPVNGEWHRRVEHSAAASANDSNNQSRQDSRERQGDPEQRPPKTLEEQPNRKEKGKDFAWFMSSLH